MNDIFFKYIVVLKDQSNEKVEWKSIGRSKQGDAQEFFVHILKSLMDDLNNMNHHNFINELFQGNFGTIIMYLCVFV